jgi:hypothetical protein
VFLIFQPFSLDHFRHHQPSNLRICDSIPAIEIVFVSWQTVSIRPYEQDEQAIHRQLRHQSVR